MCFRAFVYYRYCLLVVVFLPVLSSIRYNARSCSSQGFRSRKPVWHPVRNMVCLPPVWSTGSGFATGIVFDPVHRSFVGFDLGTWSGPRSGTWSGRCTYDISRLRQTPRPQTSSAIQENSLPRYFRRRTVRSIQENSSPRYFRGPSITTTDRPSRDPTLQPSIKYTNSGEDRGSKRLRCTYFT